MEEYSMLLDRLEKIASGLGNDELERLVSFAETLEDDSDEIEDGGVNAENN